VYVSVHIRCYVFYNIVDGNEGLVFCEEKFSEFPESIQSEFLLIRWRRIERDEPLIRREVLFDSCRKRVIELVTHGTVDVDELGTSVLFTVFDPHLLE